MLQKWSLDPIGNYQQLYYYFNDETEFENDMYLMFDSLMTKFGVLYLFDDTESPQTHEKAYLIRRANSIIIKKLNIIDKQICSHILTQKLDYIMVFQRWLKCIFKREFKIKQIGYIWDNLFSLEVENPSRQLISMDYMAIAMILYIKDELLKKEGNEMFELLLRYPEVDISVILNLANQVKDTIRAKKNSTTTSAQSQVNSQQQVNQINQNNLQTAQFNPLLNNPLGANPIGQNNLQNFNLQNPLGINTLSPNILNTGLNIQNNMLGQNLNIQNNFTNSNKQNTTIVNQSEVLNNPLEKNPPKINLQNNILKNNPQLNTLNNNLSPPLSNAQKNAGNPLSLLLNNNAINPLNINIQSGTSNLLNNNNTNPLNNNNINPLSQFSNPLNNNTNQLNNKINPLNNTNNPLGNTSNPLNNTTNSLNNTSIPLNKDNNPLNKINNPLNNNFNILGNTLNPLGGMSNSLNNSNIPLTKETNPLNKVNNPLNNNFNILGNTTNPLSNINNQKSGLTPNFLNNDILNASNLLSLQNNLNTQINKEIPAKDALKEISEIGQKYFPFFSNEDKNRFNFLIDIISKKV